MSAVHYIESPESNIDEFNQDGRDVLTFHFEGVLNDKTAQHYCNIWKAKFIKDKNKKFVIIFDALSMVDYEPLARTQFQKSIKELQSQILEIWVVSNSKVVKAGAALLSIFSSFPIKAINSFDEIKI